MKKIISLLFILTSLSCWAQDTTIPTQSIISFHGLLISIIVVLLIVMLLVVFTLYHVVNVLKHETLGLKYEDKEEQKQPFWEKALSLKPLSAEKDIELDHDFDGIKELNNPIPFWFNALFYGTICIAFVYIFVYFVFDAAPLQAKEYENEVAAATIAKNEYIKKAGSLVDENNVTTLTDVAKIESGKQLFISKCAVCHGDLGEGKVGPNLTDAYWLHGGTITDVFKTIKYGVPAKGMISWQNTLNGGQIQEVASFILTLQGTNPPGAKEPQGDLVAATTAKSDSTQLLNQ